MQRIMRPIEVITVTNCEGKITPLKFKIAQDDEEHIIKIDKIVYQQAEKIAGSNMILYECLSTINSKEHRLQIKYELKTCKWWLYKL